jgi:hypothetical protein
MSKPEAERLAAAVREVHPVGVSVQPDQQLGQEFYVVWVADASGRWTLYDEDDWRTYEPSITDG